jgi:FtsH-binding integral membrane protein
MNSLVPSQNGRTFVSRILKVLGTVFIIPACFALLLGLLSLASGGGGFSDAAPWWVVFMSAVVILGVPGVLVLFIGRKLVPPKI